MFKLSEAGEEALINFVSRSVKASAGLSLTDVRARLEPAYDGEDGDSGENVGVQVKFSPGECGDHGTHVLRFTGDDVEGTPGKPKPKAEVKKPAAVEEVEDEE